MVCWAPDQRPADRTIKLAGRFRAPPVWTIRIVSFPPDGRPVGSGAEGIAVYGPDADEDLAPVRSIARSDRIAVLGSVLRANRPVPTLMVFTPGGVMQGVAPWALERKDELAQLAGVEADRCGLGFDDDGDVVVVAPELIVTRRSPRRTSEWILRLVIVTAAGAPLRRVDVSLGGGLDLPAGFDVSPRVGAVCGDGNSGLFVALSVEGLDPQIVLRFVGALDAARAAVVKLRRSTAVADALEPDPVFGDGGFWVTTAADGEVTTAELMELDAATGPIVAGRAASAGTSSFFAASIDAGSGALNWSVRPAPAGAGGPSGLAVQDGARILLCGSTRERDLLPSPAAEVVIVGLSTDGQPDAGFGQSGLARLKLFGSSYAGDVQVTAAGEPLLACGVRWGRLASVPTFHVCVSRLTPGGRLSQGFGFPGLCRHDGIGDATSIAVGPTGQVWSAGIVKQFVGLIKAFLPWEEDKPDFQHVLSVSRLGVDGELDTGFGFGGIQTHQLGTLLPAGEGFLELTSLVPLADGRAVLTGNYERRVLVNASTGETAFEFRGSWVVRLKADGTLDSGFGTDGLRKFVGKAYRLVAELDDGSLQGYDDLAPPNSVPLRMNANGTAAPGFTNFVKPIPISPVTMPTTVEPNGEWFAPILGAGSAIGLVRCLPDGTIDPGFGAGAANPPAAAFVDIASAQTTTVLIKPEWEQGEPHRTIRLGNGTLLTIWSFKREVTLTIGFGTQARTYTRYPVAMVLVAWSAAGLPQQAKVIPHPAGSLIWKSWISWRSTCALLQPDGSILVGLVGDDADAVQADPRPRTVRQSAYFGRLVPPGFGLDPNFGTNGVLVRRLPDDGYRHDQVWLDSQAPASLGAAGPNTVVAALSCLALREPGPPGSGTPGSSVASADPVPTYSPNLPFDGSVGIARLT